MTPKVSAATAATLLPRLIFIRPEFLTHRGGWKCGSYRWPAGGSMQGLTAHASAQRDPDPAMVESGFRGRRGAARSHQNPQGRTFPMTDAFREILIHPCIVADQLHRTTGTIYPWVFHRQGRPIKAFVTAWRRVSGNNSPRSPTYRRPKSDPSSSLGTGRHGDGRPPNTLGVGLLTHREQPGPTECFGAPK